MRDAHTDRVSAYARCAYGRKIDSRIYGSQIKIQLHKGFIQMNEKISRRTLLKLMGTAAGAAALAPVTFLTGCKKEISPDKINDNSNAQPEPQAKAMATKRIVFYFTGTGNCLYVAKSLSDNPVSIPQAMKLNQLEYEAEEIGFVYPVYGMMPPNIVRKFIQSAKLKAIYFFAVATYGSRQGNAVNIWNEITKASGYSFDYIATLLMVDNWLPAFDMDEQKKMDKNIPQNLDKIKAAIDKREKFIEPVPEDAVERWNKRKEENSGPFRGDGVHAKAEEWFTITDRCVSCGICVRVCPRANYKIDVEHAATSGECELCLACVHACPHKAIQLTQGEKNPNARFRNPNVKLNEIQRANDQRG